MDRSAAYAARWVAKSLVKAKLCRRVLVQVSWPDILCSAEQFFDQVKKHVHEMSFSMLQVSYAIGVAHPLSISIFHYGTSQKTEQELLKIVKKNFDLRPGVIVR